MNSKYIRIFIFFLCLLSIKTFAQTALTGKVYSSANNTPIGGALLQIPDLKASAITDSEGNYTFSNLPTGTYLVEVDALGYASSAQSVRTGGNAAVNFPLTISVFQENEVVVTGASSARNKQMNPQSVTEVTNECCKTEQKYTTFNLKIGCLRQNNFTHHTTVSPTVST